MAETIEHQGMAADNTEIWLDQVARPRDYNELDWVNARSLLHPVVELADPTGEELLIDIGTGTGAVLRYVAPHVRHAIGVDVSKAMLAQIPADSAPNISLALADMRGHTAFPDGYADIVTTRMMLHDLLNPKGAIEESWRLVRPGGKLVAAEYVTDVCSPAAVEQTDAFEANLHPSSLIDEQHFGAPSEALVAFHRHLFGLKKEPDRFLWTAADFTELFSEVCGTDGTVSVSYSMTPFNSVGNWLGKSGFGTAVKQQGLLACLALPPDLQQELGLTITVHGSPVNPADQPEWTAQYAAASPEARETMGIDAKIHRVFANVMAEKKA
ncbi:MAG TPA: class I SAM-dependent methyltransferase [Candidatus Saccharimonadales bacterium]|jgi:SAM-dependent methyltransferase|nr:class I SAM-dependent methyltransferase [Candidatus Saccharimonadales bacterium]